MSLFRQLGAARRHLRPAEPAPPLPERGFTEGRSDAGYIEQMTDEELRELNAVLPWRTFTVDSQGRRIGDKSWDGKRDKPQLIPDPRVTLAGERFSLAGKRVLELGCFEGVHTIALCRTGALVTAVDARVTNVTKTIVRCQLYGAAAKVFACDVEARPQILPETDVTFHIGVLYHLRNPVEHLEHIAALTTSGLLLDTHVAAEGTATASYDHGGVAYPYFHYAEPGRHLPLAGMYDHAKWLLLDDLVAVLHRVGFAQVDVVEHRAERNGPRVLIVARKAAQTVTEPPVRQ